MVTVQFTEMEYHRFNFSIRSHNSPWNTMTAFRDLVWLLNCEVLDMINNVSFSSPNTILGVQGVNRGTQNSKLSVWRSETRTAPPTMPVFTQGALYSGSAYFPGRGIMNASVNWSENSTESKPIMLVSGTDVDGTVFKVEISVHDIDPSRASTIELFVMRAYLGPSRDLALVCQRSAAAENAFGQIDIIQQLKEHMENFRFHGVLNRFLSIRDVLDELMRFPVQ